MFQVRIHGRGGQGVVSAAEMLSIAAFIEDQWAQAIPSFGSERMGAPVTAFCRINHTEIRSREPVTQPDAVIIQDPTLLNQINVLEGLRRNGFVLINSKRDVSALGMNGALHDLPPQHCCTIPATELALRHVGRPVPNAVLLGAFCAVTGRVRLDSVEAAIKTKFSGSVGEKNIAAAREAFALASEALRADRGSKREEVHAQAG